MQMELSSRLNLYMTVPCTESLGPYKRFAIWVQGCNRRCSGCITKDAWPIDGGESIAVSELIAQIIEQKEIEGITISGGEPFLQEDALCDLICRIKHERDLGVIIYTGFNYSDIKDSRLAKLCDLMIDGEYVNYLDDGMSLRGSSNQNIINVTKRYIGISDEYYGRLGRKVEFLFREGRMDMVGIPPKELVEIQVNRSKV